MSATREARANWVANKQKVLTNNDARIRDEAFKASDVAHHLGIDTQTAGRLLVEMCDRDGTLERATPGKGGALRFLIKANVRPLRMPWRKRTNAQVGVTVSYQFGVTV